MTPPDISFREETTNQFLDRRERELTAQISALNGQLAPKTAELLQIRRMRAALAPDITSLNLSGGATQPPHVSSNYNAALVNVIGGLPMPSYHEMTIKQLVIQAMLDHFPSGAPATAIREFIRDAYNRGVEPGSMRTQMHRLKADKILEHDTEKDRWDFAKGQRALYDTYRQVPPAITAPELQDSPEYGALDAEDDGLLEAARKLAWVEPELKTDSTPAMLKYLRDKVEGKKK